MTKTGKFLAATVAGWLLLVGAAFAQYKSVGPDGNITYSDRPPPSSSRIISGGKKGATAPENPPLPFALQQATTKYPVTLYTGDRCTPCDDARGYLRTRGVPFIEKTVTSDDDIAAFKQQSPEGTAPLLVVGSRRTTGFSQTAISSLLDSAGYPATSVLPKDYQNPLATALSPNTKSPGQPIGTQASNRGTASPTASPTPTTPGAPPGFRF